MKRILALLAATTVLLSGCGGKLQSPDFQSALNDIEIISPVTPPTVAIGGTLKLSVNGLYNTPPGSDSAVTRGSVKDVQWVSDNTALARVDSSGLVSGLACGTSRIRARVQGFEKAIDINVGGEVLRQINVSPTTFTVHAGESKEYSATGVYRDCAGNARTSTTITQPITWSAVDPTVVDLAPNGASVVAKGKAVTSGTRIQARATNEEGNPVIGEAMLVVNPALLKDLVITGVGITAPYSVPVGGSLNFQVMGIYSDSNTPRSVPTDPSPVTWTSGNTTRATFASATSNTQNTLTAQSKDADPSKNVFNISVSAPDGEGAVVISTQPLQITISDAVLQSVTDIVAANSAINPLRVSNGDSVQLLAKGQFTDGSIVTISDSLVVWSVAAGASPAGSATITTNGNGVTGGLLSGTALGNVNVTATATSATGNPKFVARPVLVTDTICVQPYSSADTPAASASGTVTGACLSGCKITNTGSVVSPDSTDFTLMSLGTPVADATDLRLSITGGSVTASPGQRAGFVVAYPADSGFNPADIKIAFGGGAAMTPQSDVLDDAPGGFSRSLITVPVTGSFTSISATVTRDGLLPLPLPIPGLPIPIDLPIPGLEAFDLRFYSACSAAAPPRK